jgi:hypothetical protein
MGALSVLVAVTAPASGQERRGGRQLTWVSNQGSKTFMINRNDGDTYMIGSRRTKVVATAAAVAKPGTYAPMTVIIARSGADDRDVRICARWKGAWACVAEACNAQAATGDFLLHVIGAGGAALPVAVAGALEITHDVPDDDIPAAAAAGADRRGTPMLLRAPRTVGRSRPRTTFSTRKGEAALRIIDQDIVVSCG